VVAGAFAKLALKDLGISIQAYTQQVGSIALPGTHKDYDLSQTEINDVRCPDAAYAQQMADLIMEVKAEGDTIGGVIACVIKGCPIGLGEPAFDKLHALLGHAMLSINAVKGFEYGQGFAGVTERGSQQNDKMIPLPDGKVGFATNRSGGIQGGISNGEDIYFRVAFKPVATLLMEQDTVNKDGEATKLTARGRHDACVLPRAVPVVEAMAAITILDAFLLNSKFTNSNFKIG
jgi:chorismate synthase